MLIACVLVPHLAFRLEVQRDPSLDRRRVIIFHRHGSRRTVLDTSPGMGQIKWGMPLQEALARCKDGVPIEANLPYYQKVFDQILLRLGNWSPVVEGADLGRVYIGLDGLENADGRLNRLIDALLRAVPPHLEPRLGVSTGKFPAYLAALRADPGRVYWPPKEVREFLAPFPVEVLPVPWEVKERLRSFGLDSLKKIAELPPGPLQAQFGPTGVKVWRLAQGLDDTPVVPHRREEEVTSRFTFFTPTAYVESLLMAVDHLLGQLFTQPKMRGRYARTALIEGHVVDMPIWERRITFKAPVSNRSSAYHVLKGALADTRLPGPLEELGLTLKDLTSETGSQESLLQDVRKVARLRQSIAQLKTSLGRNPIYRVREVEPWSRMPERRRALMTYDP